MDRILNSLKKENSPRASSAPALGLNTIIFKHVYWYMLQTQVSVYRTIGPLVLDCRGNHSGLQELTYNLSRDQENRSSGFPSRSNTNRPVQSQKKARSLKKNCTIRVAKTKAKLLRS